MKNIFAVTISNLDENFSSLIDAINASRTIDWPNFVCTLLAVFCAAISALCALSANKSAKKQSDREYFDKIGGDDFLKEIVDLKMSYKNVSSNLVRYQGTMDQTQIENYTNYINRVRTLVHNLNKKSLLFEHVTNDGGKLPDVCDEIDEKIYLLKCKITDQEDDWYEKANILVEDAAKLIDSLSDVFFSLRKNFVQK